MNHLHMLRGRKVTNRTSTTRRKRRWKLESLEERCMLSIAWGGYGNDSQHAAQATAAAQSLQQIHWQATIDEASHQAGGTILTHFGSPVITGANTVIVPITGQGTGMFDVKAYNGTTGALLWTVPSDYTLPPHNWVPSFSPALVTIPGGNTRLYFPAADGTVKYLDNPDSPTLNPNGTPVVGRYAFYGLNHFNTDVASSQANIKINTPLTGDASGNLYFGYQITGTNAANLTNGIARLAPDGTGTFVSVAAVSQVANFNKVSTNCAPAITNDGSKLYIGVCSSTRDGVVPDAHFGELLELNTSDLSYVAKVALLEPPASPDAGKPAILDGDSSASPTIGPDGDVYYGVLEHGFATNNDRGWLLHYSADLSQTKTPGDFGWDVTPSIVPRSLVPSYQGTSPYLIFVKYNDYAGLGGSGINKIAVLDPNSADGRGMMSVVASIAGPTPDQEYIASYPNAVREWCINTTAVDINPATHSIYANSEDGKLYRWDLYSPGAFSEVITLTAGIGEAYTPTAVGPDGTVYAINDAVLFAVGANHSSATFLKQDTTTQGTWKNAYGADGFNISQDSSANNPSIPAYASVNITNASGTVWSQSTTDVRALQKAAAGSLDRIAATWFGNSFSIDVTINDGKAHQIALYGLDWDSTTRAETIQVIDTATGAVLDTQSLTNFHNGNYLVWNVAGSVTFRVTNTGSSNAVISGLFFGGAPVIAGQATFLKTDTTTQGNWKAAYGAEGFDISQDPSANNPSFPAYASVSFSNNSNAVWSSSTSDVRALQKAAPGSTDRIAATWFSGSNFSVDVKLHDGNTHQVALYGLDWDSSTRTETIQVIDDASGTVLDTRSLAGFHNGSYLVWNIQGSVTFKVTNTNPSSNAVISGLFFGSAPGAASFVKQDTTTQGNWKTAYGADGYNISQDPSANNPSIPAYASVNFSNAAGYTWTGTTADVRALQKAATGSVGRIAAAWYSGTSYSIDVKINDGKVHQVALYALDWDNSARTETIQVIDDATGAILDTRSLASFQNGVYLAWNIQGNVTFKVTNTGSSNAVLSGLFFGGAPVVAGQAAFVKQDSSTEGTWKGTYGVDGFDDSQDPSLNNPSFPAYATVNLHNTANAVWASSTTNLRALQKTAAGSTDRIAATWYSPDSFSVDVHISDGKTHQIALYALDWDNSGRTETIQVLDAATGAVLDTRALASFQNGVYLVWTIAGDVTFKLTNASSANAVLSGIFLG